MWLKLFLRTVCHAFFCLNRYVKNWRGWWTALGGVQKMTVKKVLSGYHGKTWVCRKVEVAWGFAICMALNLHCWVNTVGNFSKIQAHWWRVFLKPGTFIIPVYLKLLEGEVWAISGLGYRKLKSYSNMVIDGWWVMEKKLECMKMRGWRVNLISKWKQRITTKELLVKLVIYSFMGLKNGIIKRCITYFWVVMLDWF